MARVRQVAGATHTRCRTVAPRASMTKAEPCRPEGVPNRLPLLVRTYREHFKEICCRETPCSLPTTPRTHWSALRGDRFDQRRVVVFDVADALADRPTCHRLGRTGSEQ